MTPVLCFVDTGVLIAATRADDPVLKANAFALLNDPGRAFAASALVRQEALPKALHHGHQEEAEFYEVFFASLDPAHYVASVDALLADAFDEVTTSGVGPWDAFHVVAAAHVGATELVTSEAPKKSIFRTKRVKVVSIRPGTEQAGPPAEPPTP